MSLTPAERARYARHTLLPEIGITGQTKLCAAHVRIHASADPQAALITRDYLTRAGVTVQSEAPITATVASTQDVNQLAGDELRHASQMLVGAFAAVEVIKALVGSGTPAQLPAGFRLSSEES